MYQNFIIPYLYEAQHVSGDTPPIIRSMCMTTYCAWQRPPATRPTTFHVWKTRGCQCSFRLLMMGGVSPETCWATYKYGIIKFWYIVASCWIFLYELYMHIFTLYLYVFLWRTLVLAKSANLIYFLCHKQTPVVLKTVGSFSNIRYCSTNLIEHTRSWQAKSSNLAQTFPAFMGPEFSSPCPKNKPDTALYFEPD